MWIDRKCINCTVSGVDWTGIFRGEITRIFLHTVHTDLTIKYQREDAVLLIWLMTLTHFRLASRIVLWIIWRLSYFIYWMTKSSTSRTKLSYISKIIRVLVILYISKSWGIHKHRLTQPQSEINHKHFLLFLFWRISFNII